MRRLVSITALSTLLLISLSLQAQRGSMGGRGFSGGGRSFSGGARGGSGFRSSAPSGGRFFAPSGPRGFAPGQRMFVPGGSRGFAPAARPFGARTFAARGGFRTFSPAHRVFTRFPGRFNRFHHGFFHDRFFFPGCFGCVSPFLFGGGLFFDPFVSPFYSGFAPDYYAYGPPAPEPVVVNSDNGSSAQLAAEVERLSDEIDDMRYEESRNREDNRAPSDPRASISVMEPVANVSFIFHDGRHITARNYAIAGQTLWILDEHAARKFALDDLDIPATEKANAVNGVEIHFPTNPVKQ